MGSPFSKTLGFLEAEERGVSGAVALGVLVLLAALIAWLSCARTTVYAVSEDGRLLAAGAASPVQAPVAGIVGDNALALGADVSAGDVLLRLDVQAETLRRSEEETRIQGLALAAESLALVIEAERGLANASARASVSRVSSAAARAQAATDVAVLARAQDDAVRRLRDASLITGLEALKTAEEVQRQRGQVTISFADTAQASADLIRVGKETDVRLLMLGRELTDIRARIAGSQAVIASLDYEIARRTLRAPVGGKIADVAVAPKGAAVSPGQVLATIVPQAPLRWVAYFSPRDAVGRMREGQSARIRLDAFPWTAYGALRARVIRVGSEPREQRVRVELEVDADNPNIPLSHGMTGVTDVEVEQVSPMRLLLRLSGQYVQGRADPPPAAPSAARSL
jgi:multidrug resistance efflux pump